MAEIIDITNAVKSSRFFDRLGQLLGMSHDNKRDIYEIYGYDDTLSGTDGFVRMYRYSRRQGIANRITWGIARTSWRDGFHLLDDPDDEDSQQLVDELTELQQRGLHSALERADILNRIGRFSVLLVGVPDGLELDQPLGRVTGDGLAATYFQAYAYDSVEIVEWERDKQSPRYGQPLIYQISESTRRGEQEKDNVKIQARRVHYTRIVHFNENSLDSPVEGMGALEPVFNRILDLDKAVGGSAEAYFRNARGKIAYEIDKDFASSLLNDKDARDTFDTNVEKFTNEWQDHTIAAGAKTRSITTAHHSPLDTVKVSLWEISGYTGIPIRILTGEGSGQLAGSEDQLALNQIIADRQRAHCAPKAMEVLQVLAAAGVLQVDETWSVVFPQQQATTQKEQSEIDERRANVLDAITRAKSAIGGDEIDLASALEEFNLGGITLDATPPSITDPDEE